jgi:hypothetical protein
MNIDNIHIFNEFAKYLSQDDIEVLYMTGQKKIQLLITSCDVFDRPYVYKNNQKEKENQKTRLYHKICVPHLSDIGKYTKSFRYKKSLASNGIEQAITHMIHNQYRSLDTDIEPIDLSKFINLKMLYVDTLHKFPISIPNSVESLLIYLNSVCNDNIYLYGITSVSIYGSCNSILSQYTKFDEIINYTTITHIQFTNTKLPENIMSMLPISILHLRIVKCNDNQIIDMKCQKTPNLLSLITNASIDNISSLPKSLVELSVRDTIKDMINLSILPSLKILHEHCERTLNEIPRDYSTLPSSLLELQVKDRHINEDILNIIMKRCPKLARFHINIDEPEYKHLETIFARKVCGKY